MIIIIIVTIVIVQSDNNNSSAAALFLLPQSALDALTVSARAPAVALVLGLFLGGAEGGLKGFLGYIFP